MIEDKDVHSIWLFNSSGSTYRVPGFHEMRNFKTLLDAEFLSYRKEAIERTCLYFGRARGGKEHIALGNAAALWLQNQGFEPVFERNWVDVSSKNCAWFIEVGDVNPAKIYQPLIENQQVEHVGIIPFQPDDEPLEMAVFERSRKWNKTKVQSLLFSMFIESNVKSR